MNWFKHYANMAMDERMMRMESEMGYIGTGIFWRAMELINGMGGSYPLKGLLYTIKNRHAKQGKVMQVIMGYGLFEVDSVGLVRFCEVSKRALAEPSQLPNGTASEDAIIGTRVVEREEREKAPPLTPPWRWWQMMMTVGVPLVGTRMKRRTHIMRLCQNALFSFFRRG